MKIRTKFITEDDNIRVIKMNEDNTCDTLLPQVYTVKYADIPGFYLSVRKDLLKVPNKIYGNAIDRVEKCVKTYNDRSASTGILLTGDKGTGKSLFMSLLANEMIKQNHPVLIINEAYAGEAFNEFITNIGECVLLFDEFGKMYSGNSDRNSVRSSESDRVSQSSLLSIMDGIDKTKRMFILSENSSLKIDEFMLNRPSRIFYHFKYSKLDEDSITVFCLEKLITEDVTNEIIEISRRSVLFSFDMLQSIVDEYLRFGGSINSIISDLNIDLNSNADVYIVECVVNSTGNECKIINSDLFFYDGSYINIQDPDLDDSHELYIDEKCITYSKNNHILCENSGYKFHIRKREIKMTNYSAYFNK